MKSTLLLIGLFLAGLLSAQDIQLTVQTGHAAAINSVTFSSDDKLLLTGGADQKVVLWDWATAKQYGVLLGHTAPVTEALFYDNDRLVISSSLDSTVRIWDVTKEQCGAILRFDYPVGDIEIRPGHPEIAVVGERLTILNLQTKTRTEFEFPAENLFTTVDFTEDGDLVAFGGDQEHFMYILDLKEMKLFEHAIGSAKSLLFWKNNSLFRSSAEGRIVESCLAKDKHKSASTDWMLNTINAIAVNDEQVFAANNAGEIHIYKRNRKWKFGGIFKNRDGKIKDIELSNNGKYLATVGVNRNVVVWDIKEKTVIKSMRGRVEQINDIAFSADGAFLTVGYNNGALRRTNLISNQSVTNSLRPRSDILASFSGYTIENIEVNENDSVIVNAYYQMHSLVYEGAYDDIQYLTVKWSLKDNVLSIEKQRNKPDKLKRYIKDLKDGVIHDNQFFLDQRLLSTRNDSIQIKAEIRGQKLIVRNLKSGGKMHEIETGHSDVVTAVAINPVYSYIATASWDGMIRFWDIQSGKLLTVYGAFGNGQFVYLDQKGYYFASKDALDYIAFKMNGKIYSFEQFDLKYNRPDIVAESLPYFDEEYINAYFRAYKKRLSKLGITEEQLSVKEGLPVVQYDKKIVENRKGDILHLKISASDEQNELSKLHVRVNGVPEFGRFGQSISGHNFQKDIEVKLNPGNNDIQLYVTNENGISSYRQSFEIESHQKRAKSTVYIVAIGVSSYQQEKYNLKYARKDAEDFSRFFKFDKFLLNNVSVKSLTDDEVTKSNVEALKSFTKQAKENDVLMFFAAGHGVLDANLDYYFAAHDMDFDNPSDKGIPYELFEEILDASKSRKKVMFLDACHSGEIDKEEVKKNVITDENGEELIFRGADISVENKYDINSFELSRSLFADMRLNNGSTVVSSAGGAEFAIEGDEWNNGVFTYCLLNGLKTKSADLNGDKIIMLSELQKYIHQKVVKITDGQQTPTSRVENLKNDFRIL